VPFWKGKVAIANFCKMGEAGPPASARDAAVAFVYRRLRDDLPVLKVELRQMLHDDPMVASDVMRQVMRELPGAAIVKADRGMEALFYQPLAHLAAARAHIAWRLAQTPGVRARSIHDVYQVLRLFKNKLSVHHCSHLVPPMGCLWVRPRGLTGNSSSRYR